MANALAALGLNIPGAKSAQPAQAVAASMGFGGFPIPNLSAGGGGPSSAQGYAMGGGGFDGSGWAVNFGAGSQTTSDSRTAPSSVTTAAGQSGLPVSQAYPASLGGRGVAGGGMDAGLLLLIVGAFVLMKAAK